MMTMMTTTTQNMNSIVLENAKFGSSRQNSP